MTFTGMWSGQNDYFGGVGSLTADDEFRTYYQDGARLGRTLGIYRHGVQAGQMDVKVCRSVANVVRWISEGTIFSSQLTPKVGSSGLRYGVPYQHIIDGKWDTATDVTAAGGGLASLRTQHGTTTINNALVNDPPFSLQQQGQDLKAVQDQVRALGKEPVMLIELHSEMNVQQGTPEAQPDIPDFTTARAVAFFQYVRAYWEAMGIDSIKYVLSLAGWNIYNGTSPDTYYGGGSTGVAFNDDVDVVGFDSYTLPNTDPNGTHSKKDWGKISNAAVAFAAANGNRDLFLAETGAEPGAGNGVTVSGVEYVNDATTGKTTWFNQGKAFLKATPKVKYVVFNQRKEVDHYYEAETSTPTQATGTATGGYTTPSWNAFKSLMTDPDLDEVLGDVTPPPPPEEQSVFIQMAGDIAGTTSTTGGGAKSGRALDTWVGDGVHSPLTILPLGDNAYNDGALADYNTKYDPFWGAGSTAGGYTWKDKKALTKPVPGNHEWNTADAAGYRTYFGGAVVAYSNEFQWVLEPQAPDGNRYWRIIGVDSDVYAADAAHATWLEAQLDASLTAGPNGGPQHIIVVQHHPMWTPGGYSPGFTQTGAFFDKLQLSKYDGVLRFLITGHDHLYARYNPLRKSGTITQVASDLTHGVVCIVAGMGGHAPDAVAGGADLTNVAKVLGGSGATGILRAELTQYQFKGEYILGSATGPGTLEESFTLGDAPDPNPVAEPPVAHVIVGDETNNRLLLGGAFTTVVSGDGLSNTEQRRLAQFGEGTTDPNPTTMKWRWRAMPPWVAGVVSNLSADPSSVDYLWVSAATGGIRESRDGGTSWAPTMKGLFRADHRFAATVAAVRSPIDLGLTRVVAGFGEATNGGTATLEAGSDVWTDTNTAVEFDAGPADPLLQARPRSAGRLIDGDSSSNGVNQDGYLYAGSFSKGLARSTTGGATWAYIALTDATIRHILVDPTDPTSVWVGVKERSTGAAGGAYKVSGARGTNVTATRLTPDTMNSVEWIEVVDMGVGETPHIFLACAHGLAGTGDVGVWRSIDGGITWAKLAPSSALSSKQIRSLSAKRRSDGSIILLVGVHNDAQSIWRSLNAHEAAADVSFTHVTGTPNQTLPDTGVTYDHGAPVSDLKELGEANCSVVTVVSDPHRVDRYWLLTDTGQLYRSTEYGVNWQKLATGLTLTSFGALAYDKTRAGYLVAGDNENGVWFSNNYGASVTRKSPAGSPSRCYDTTVDYAGIYWACLADPSVRSGGLYRGTISGSDLSYVLGQTFSTGRPVAHAVGKSPGGAPGNVAITVVTSGVDDQNLTTYVLPSITAEVGKVYFLALGLLESGGAAAAPTSVTGPTGTTWTHVNTYASGTAGISVWQGTVSSGASGTVSVTFPTQHEGIHYAVVACENVAASPVVQSVTNFASSGTTGSVTLAAFADVQNAALGFVQRNAIDGTAPGSGFIELVDMQAYLQPPTTAPRSLQGQWKLNDNTVDWEWATSNSWRAVALELDWNSGASPSTKRHVIYKDADTTGNTGLYYSDVADGSGTFTKAATGPTDLYPSSFYPPVSLVWGDPEDGAHVYCFVRKTPTGADAGVWISVDRGLNWTKVMANTTAVDSRHGFVASKKDGVVYVTDGTGTLTRLRLLSGSWQSEIVTAPPRAAAIAFGADGHLYIWQDPTFTEPGRLLRVLNPSDTEAFTFEDISDIGKLADNELARNMLTVTQLAAGDQKVFAASDTVGLMAADYVEVDTNTTDLTLNVTDSGIPAESSDRSGAGLTTLKSGSDSAIAAETAEVTYTQLPDPLPVTWFSAAELMPTFRISVRWDTTTMSDNAERFLNSLQDTDVVEGLQFTSEMPGGYATCSFLISEAEFRTAEGQKAYRYGATVTVRIANQGAAGNPQPNADQLVWQGMLRTPTPKPDGTVEMNAVGWKVMAEEREEDVLFVDESVSSWQTPGGDPFVDGFDKGDSLEASAGDAKLKFVASKGSDYKAGDTARIGWWFSGHQPKRVAGFIRNNIAVPTANGNPLFAIRLEKFQGPGQPSESTSMVLVRNFSGNITDPAGENFQESISGEDRPAIFFAIRALQDITNLGSRFVVWISDVRVHELAFDNYDRTASDVLRTLNNDSLVARPLGYNINALVSDTDKDGGGLPSVMPLWWQGGSWWEMLEYLATMHAFKLAVWEGDGTNQQGKPKLEFRPWNQSTLWDVYGWDSTKAHAVVEISDADDMFSEVEVSYRIKGSPRVRRVRQTIVNSSGVAVFAHLPKPRRRTLRFNIEDPVPSNVLPVRIAEILASEHAEERYSGTITTSFVRDQATVPNKINASLVRSGDRVRVLDWPYGARTFRIYGTDVQEDQVQLIIGRTPMRVDQLVARNQLRLRRRGLLESSPA